MSQQIKKQEERKPFYIRHFKAVVVILVLFIGLAGYFALVKPAMTSYQQNKQQYEKQEKQLNLQKTRLSKNVEKLNAFKGITEVEQNKINQILPDSPDKPNLYVNLQSLAERAQVDLTNINLEAVEQTQKRQIFGEQDSQQQSNIGIVRINLTMENVNYPKLKNLLTLFEDNLRLLDLQQVEYNAAEAALFLLFNGYYKK